MYKCDHTCSLGASKFPTVFIFMIKTQIQSTRTVTLGPTLRCVAQFLPDQKILQESIYVFHYEQILTLVGY